MHRPLAFLVLVAGLAGCSKYTTRGQGPFNRPLPSPYAGNIPPGPQQSKNGLAMNAATPPAPTDEQQLTPPRPPNAPTGFAVGPPGPRPPAVADQPGAIVPAAGAVAEPPKPAGPSPAAVNLSHLKKLAQVASDQWKKVDTYEARLVRQEVVYAGDGKATEGKKEEVLYRFRRDPMAVYMKNLGDVGKGREVLYNPSKHGEKLHIVTGAGDFISGMEVTKSPDDPMVRDRSRQSIRDAGFGRGITAFAGTVEKIEGGRLPPDVLKYLGPTKRPEYVHPLEAVAQTIRPGDDKQSPHGGTRTWFFDGKPESPSYGLPVLVVTTEPGGKDIEYYCFTQFRLPAGFTDADFDPARVHRRKK